MIARLAARMVVVVNFMVVGKLEGFVCLLAAIG
jgi:hypothetical protein